MSLVGYIIKLNNEKIKALLPNKEQNYKAIKLAHEENEFIKTLPNKA